jgi:hypothetical protein
MGNSGNEQIMCKVFLVPLKLFHLLERFMGQV